MTLGIMGAMPEEMNKIIAAISNKEIIERGSHDELIEQKGR